jgi:hypothetical protein
MLLDAPAVLNARAGACRHTQCGWRASYGMNGATSRRLEELDHTDADGVHTTLLGSA